MINKIITLFFIIVLSSIGLILIGCDDDDPDPDPPPKVTNGAHEVLMESERICLVEDEYGNCLEESVSYELFQCSFVALYRPGGGPGSAEWHEVELCTEDGNCYYHGQSDTANVCGNGLNCKPGELIGDEYRNSYGALPAEYMYPYEVCYIPGVCSSPDLNSYCCQLDGHEWINGACDTSVTSCTTDSDCPLTTTPTCSSGSCTAINCTVVGDCAAVDCSIFDTNTTTYNVTCSNSECICEAQ